MIHYLPILCVLTTFGMAQATAATLTYCPPIDPKPMGHVIFDMGGVLIHPSMSAVFKEMGGYISSTAHFAGYLLHTGSPSKLKKTMYAILQNIQPSGNTSQTKDKDGNLLPGLMCEWLNGTKTCAQLRQIVIPALEKNPQWFNNIFERRLVCRLIMMMFTPDKFAKTQYIQPGAKKLIQKLIRQGYGVHILSNWDPESFKIMRDNNAEFFNLFDSIIISGNIGTLKPESASFASFIGLSGPLFFIDDQKENIQAAQHEGIIGVHLASSNLRKVPYALRVVSQKAGAENPT